MTEDFYDLLDVPRDASQDRIKEAFREKVREYHPDLNDDPRAQAQFTALKKAYDTLGEPSERNAYDRLGHEDYVAKRIKGLPSQDKWATDDDGDTSSTDSGTTAGSTTGASTTGTSGGAASKGRTGTSSGTSRSTGSTTGQSSSTGRSSSTSSSTGRSSDTGSSTGRSSGTSTSTGRSSSTGSTTSGSTDSASSSGTTTGGSTTSGTSGTSATSTTSGSTTTGSTGTSSATTTSGSTTSTATGRSNRTTTTTTPSSSTTTDSETGLLERIKGIHIGWPHIVAADIVYVAAVALYLVTIVDLLRSFGSAAATAAQTRAIAPLRSEAVVSTDAAFDAFFYGTEYVASVSVSAKGGLLVLGAVVLPLIYTISVRRTRRWNSSWSPTWLYVLASLAPIGGIVAHYVGYDYLGVDVVALGLLPIGAVVLLPLSAFVRPKIKKLIFGPDV